MTRDTTLRATARRLTELGYAPTSATHPDRFVAHFHGGRRETLLALADHPAAVMLWPLPENGSVCDDFKERRLLELLVTAYLTSDARQLKAVMAVLESYKLTGGPCMVDTFGNRHYVLQWNAGEEIVYGRHARLCFEGDDYTVKLVQAIRPDYAPVRNEIGGYQVMPKGPPRTHIVPLDGKWENGGLLDTPRRKLPELLHADIAQLIEDVELARWGARPLAKDAAA